MPRMILRIMAATMAICMVCLNPTQTSARNLDNGTLSENTMKNVDEYVSLTCPLPITISCDDNGIYQTFAEFENAGGSVILPDGCEESDIVLTWQGDDLLSQNGCSFVYFREYLLTADCNNTFTCNQMVMQNDNDNPIITECASDTTLMMDNSGGTCLVSFAVPSITATDGCDMDVMITNDSPGTFGVGMTTVTYTASDNCGNIAQCSIVVTVVDNNPLSVTCPPDIDVSNVCDIFDVPAYADYAAFTAAGGGVSGNCSTSSGGTFTITNVSTTVALSTCPFTHRRTYTISDGSNSGSCTQMITIRDLSPPTFLAPADLSVDCGSAQDTSVTGAPSAILDNCTTNPQVSWFDKDSTQLSTGCVGEISFIRSWVVTDDCLNADTLNQMITTIDTVAPIAVCKDTLVLFLDAIGDALFIADSLDNGSTDNCSDLSFSAIPTMTFVSCNQIAGDIPVTMVVTDGCGNTSSCDLMIKLSSRNN